MRPTVDNGYIVVYILINRYAWNTINVYVNCVKANEGGENVSVSKYFQNYKIFFRPIKMKDYSE